MGGTTLRRIGIATLATDKTFGHHTSAEVPNGRGPGPVNRFTGNVTNLGSVEQAPPAVLPVA